MRVLEYTADGSRLDVLLSQDGVLSRSRAAELIKGGAVTVDGRAEGKPSAKPAPGALVRVEVPEPRPAQAEAQDIPLKILYQDAHLAVVVKPCGMVVHPAAGNPGWHAGQRPAVPSGSAQRHRGRIAAGHRAPAG